MMKPRITTLAGVTAAGAGLLLLFGCAATALSGDTVWGGTRRPADAPLPATAPGSRDGVYAGNATDPTGGCISPLPITNFQVSGSRVDFGGFHGPISPDATVNLQFNGAWLNGRFQGQTFTGHIDTYGSISQVQDCFFAVSLQKLGT